MEEDSDDDLDDYEEDEEDGEESADEDVFDDDALFNDSHDGHGEMYDRVDDI